MGARNSRKWLAGERRGGGHSSLTAAERKLRSGYRDFILRTVTAPGQAIYAATLTCIPDQANAGGGTTRISREILSGEVSKFLRLLNRRVYGQAFARFGKGLARAPSFEGGGGSEKNMHIHMLIRHPDRKNLTRAKFEFLLRSSWARSEWALPNSRIDWFPDDVLTAAYLVKTGGDALDLANCHDGIEKDPLAR